MKYAKERVMEEKDLKRSLDGLPLPKFWWRKQVYINESQNAREIARWRGGNAGLGNRCSTMSQFGAWGEDGRVRVCQLCHKEQLTEIHVLVVCEEFKEERRTIAWAGTTLEQWVAQQTQDGATPEQRCRRLLQVGKRGVTAQRIKLAALLINVNNMYKEKWIGKWK